MNTKRKILSTISLVLLSALLVNAQVITVNADSYKHQFEGAGVSIGLYMGHHYSMSEANQDKAIRLVNKDCNMKYLQDYIQIYPNDDPPYFDRRANYIKAAKVYRPDIKVSMVGNKFPDDLLHQILVNGQTYDALNTDDPDIYDKLANWYFELFKGFHVRGVPVEILNVVNEPDLDRVFRKYHYGLNGNTKEAVAQIFKKAVPKFKAMLNDPAINNTNMPVPLIMGPSTISPIGCLDYVKFFKTTHPDAWSQVDIVSTHQYENGSISNLFRDIVLEIEGKPFHQSETHAFMGDNLGDILPDNKPLRTVLSLSSLFGTAVTNGVSAWYYFENNYPDVFHPGGLIRVDWASNNPIPYKHYYAFKQLTSAQPAFSHVVEHEALYAPKSEVTTFRKMDEDTVYVHYSNYASINREITVKVKEAAASRKISAFSARVTDEIYNDETLVNTTYTVPVNEIVFNAGKYSVNTIKITLADSQVGISETIKNEPEINIIDLGESVEIKSLTPNQLRDIKVYSINGKLLAHKANVNSPVYSIAKSEFGGGIYILRVSTIHSVVSTKIVF